MAVKRTKQRRKSKSKKKYTRRNNRKNFRGGAATAAAAADAPLKKVNCAPSVNKAEVQQYSCYTKSALIKLRDLWNARHHDEKIDSTEPYKIWSALKHFMRYTCNTEDCWLRQQFAQGLDKEITKYTFAPTSPKSWTKNPNEWLSSVEIENVMKQYEHSYPCFEFLGPSPIDFDKHLVDGECVWEELCEFTIQKRLQTKKTKIGIIFNTDPHNKSGSHWISMFINLKDKFILFFDSTGYKPPIQIKNFVARIVAEDSSLKYYDNTGIKHQKGSTECGMYSLYMIISLLTEKPQAKHRAYADFITNDKIIKDKDMEALRHNLFNFQPLKGGGI